MPCFIKFWRSEIRTILYLMKTWRDWNCLCLTWITHYISNVETRIASEYFTPCYRILNSICSMEFSLISACLHFEHDSHIWGLILGCHAPKQSIKYALSVQIISMSPGALIRENMVFKCSKMGIQTASWEPRVQYMAARRVQLAQHRRLMTNEEDVCTPALTAVPLYVACGWGIL